MEELRENIRRILYDWLSDFNRKPISIEGLTNIIMEEVETHKTSKTKKKV